MKKALGTGILVLGAFFVATPTYATTTAYFTSSSNSDIYVSNPSDTGSFYGCLFIGTSPTALNSLPFNSGGTAGFVVVGSSTNIISQYTPLDAPYSTPLLTYLNANPGDYTMLGASGGSGSCLGDVLLNSTVEGTFYWNNGYTPTPNGDGDFSTHIIRITSPAAYSTTTSPIPIGFDIYAASTSPPMGYDITFVNTLTFVSTSTSGWLVDSGFSSADYDSVFHVATSTPLSGDGTWKMTISLWTGGNGGPDPDPAGTQYTYFGHALTSWFGLNFNDNTQRVFFPDLATFQGYASSSCAINFLGSFSLSDCMGYLFYPAPNTLLAYPSLYLTIQEKIPFSYFFSIANTWSSLAASTTANTPTYSFALHDLGIGSSSPMGNILPNFNGLSSTTVGTYLSPTLLALFKALATAAIYLALAADVFFTTRTIFKL